MPFEPEEIDDLDETLLEEMDQEELADFVMVMKNG